MLWALLIAAGAAGAARAAPPNLLFILADDLGYGDVDIYPNPTTLRRIQTPHLAQLAKDGTAFTDAYAGYSVCAPSRTTLMTGFHVGHFHPSNIQSPVPGAEAAIDPTGGLGGLLHNGSVTVAKVLRDQAGYHTALMGKWGLDGNFKTPKPPSDGFPTLQGFEYFYGQSDQWQCHDYFPPFMFNGTESLTVPGNPPGGPSKATCGPDRTLCKWSADLWTTDAVDYITNAGGERRPPAKPFFLYLAYTVPHAGSVGTVDENDVPAPRVAEGPYANESAWPQVEIDFATTVTYLDQNIGKVLAAVDAAGVRGSTVVFFSSDNGAHQEGGHKYEFFSSSGYLNGFKRSIHDGGHRAALIVRWPGHTPAGAWSAQQFCFYDFLPTAAAIAGLPDSALPPGQDGYSLLPTLEGRAQAQPAFIYHDYSGCNDPSLKGFATGFGQNVRMGNWSGVCVGGASPCTGAGGEAWEYRAGGEWRPLLGGDAAALAAARRAGGGAVELSAALAAELNGALRAGVRMREVAAEWALRGAGAGLAVSRPGVAPVPVRAVLAPGHFFLYDMANDSAQLHDVSDAHPDVVAAMLKIMREQYAPGGWPPAPPTPAPPPVPAAALGGLWTQHDGHDSAMSIAVDGASAAVTCVAPCTCCSWRAGNFTVSTAAGTVLAGTATGPNGFATAETGSVGYGGDGALTIEWKGDRNWAKWTKQ